MKTETFSVANVKCDGCVNNIRTQLGALPGVTRVDVDIPSGRVDVQGEGLARAALSSKLKAIGYPEKGA